MRDSRSGSVPEAEHDHLTGAGRSIPRAGQHRSLTLTDGERLPMSKWRAHCTRRAVRHDTTKGFSRPEGIATAKEGKYLRRYILVAFIVTLLIGPALAQTGDTGDVDAFRQALEQDGFTVQEGEIGYFDLIKLYDEGTLPSAYGNNPATKYLAYFVPPAPGYPVDERIATIAKTLGMSGNTSSFWHLGPDEAVVFVGNTPPECRYFGYDNYLMSRTYGDGDTRWIFANVADSLNNLVINTDGISGRPVQPDDGDRLHGRPGDRRAHPCCRPNRRGIGRHDEHPGVSLVHPEDGSRERLRYVRHLHPPGSLRR